MTKNKSSEFENFDEVMGKLLAVPYSELQKRLEEEKKLKKEKKRKRSTSSGDARASSERT